MKRKTAFYNNKRCNGGKLRLEKGNIQHTEKVVAPSGAAHVAAAVVASVRVHVHPREEAAAVHSTMTIAHCVYACLLFF